jgi:hypothetical protein
MNVLASSPSFPVSRSSEKHAQIPSKPNWKPSVEAEARASSYSPLPGVPS